MENDGRMITSNGSKRKRWVSHQDWTDSVPSDVNKRIASFMKRGDIKVNYDIYTEAIANLSTEIVLTAKQSPSAFHDRYLHRKKPVEIINYNSSKYSEVKGLESLEFISPSHIIIDNLARKVGLPIR